MTAIQQQLETLVGEHRVLAPERVAERATSFWNTAPMQAAALVMPTTTQEVSDVLKHCNGSGQALLTQGGLTNCVSGVESASSDVVLSTEKMSSIVDLDPVGGTVTVEAGAVLETVQNTMADEGFRFPLDLGARGSCTIGGNVATNAGGINVLRYGMMRNLVLGLETVLADGTVISSMNRMLKNNAGYDTKQLFIGSEGTLGVVTRAVLRLFPQPTSRQNALVAMQRFEDVGGFLSVLQKELAGTLSAYEVMWNDYYRAVTGEGWHRAPLDRDYPFYVVLQAEGGDPELDEARFERVLGEALERGQIVDAAIPKSDTDAVDFWRIREDFEAITSEKPCYLYDVSLPILDMDAYVQQVYRLLEERLPGSRAFTLGHVADGNLHFFIVPSRDEDVHEMANACVYDPLKSISGSVSAEHGIGVDKLAWLPHSRSASDIALMHTLKRTLDPNNILNPERVLAI